MACNFFLMLGVMGDPGTCVAYDKKGVVENRSCVPKAANQEAQQQAQKQRTEESNTNLINALNKQANGLSEKVASVLKNNAIIALSGNEAGSKAVSNKNIHETATEEIKLVQDALIKLGKLKPTDCEYGKYDKATADAVKKYQQEKNSEDKGFLVDGVVGFQTMKALLEDAAEIKEVKDSLSGKYDSLKNHINAAWAQGGSEADTKVRQEARTQGLPQSSSTVGVSSTDTGHNTDQQVTVQGNHLDLERRLLACKEPPTEEDIKAIQEALNLYADQRNRRFGAGWIRPKVFTVNVDGKLTEDTKKLLGDFLHNNGNLNGKLNNFTVTKDLARHLRGMVVYAEARKEENPTTVTVNIEDVRKNRALYEEKGGF